MKKCDSLLKKLVLCPTMPIGPITMQKCEAKHSGANHYSKIVTILSDFAKLCKKFEAKLFRSETLKQKYFLTKRSDTFEAKQSKMKQNFVSRVSRKGSETKQNRLRFA